MTKLTQAQLAVIDSSGEHLLVDAGAGSGKTTTVVQALCHQLGVPVLVDGKPLPPVATPFTLEQVAAITYTNQAAADLKRKLRGALRAGGRRDLAAEVDAARIGTIHGFCGELLRDYALRAGVRPARRVLDEGEGSVIARDCAHDAVRESIEAGDVPGIAELLTGRRIKDISDWVADAAGDADRLGHWEAKAESLRDHERALLVLARRAAALRQATLECNGELDFDQMIVATRTLLSDAGVRHAVQKRIRLLVLDEFQDVDPVQRDIAYLLGGLAHDDPQPTRLILVGDPKQSIYRFRRADVTLWNAVKARFADGAGRVTPLTENFRSKAAILGVVDATVGVSLDKPVAEGDRRAFEVTYQPLEARAEHASGDHAVEFLVIPAAEDGKTHKAEICRTLEAAGVAQRISALKASGAAYGDMAILLAGWGDVGLYEDALKAAGIPVYVLRSEGFWAAREVLDCILALRVLRDPRDDVALVGFLKSPFIGVRDDTLLALARVANGEPLVTALGAVKHERLLLDRAIGLVETLGVLRDRVSVHDLLQRLIDQSGYLAVAALSAEAGQQCVANVRKLVRLAATAPDQSLGEFLRAVAEQRDREDKIAPERLYRERSDVVTITSIHSSKGLEWPIVFWCDMLRSVRKETEKFLPARETFCVKDDALVDDEGEPNDPVHKVLAAELALEQRAEAYRLWYVASTRAKERLILSGIPLGEMRGSDVSPARQVRESFPNLASGVEVEYTCHKGVAYHAAVSTPAPAGDAVVATPAAEPELALPPTAMTVPGGGSRLSASQLMAFNKDPKEWWERSVRRFSGTGSDSISGVRARAIATGVIVHEVLERLELDGVDLDELIEDAIANNDTDAPEADSSAGASYRAYIRKRVDAATGSSEWKAISTLPSARRELSFTRVLVDGSTINGAVDIASIEGGVAQVLDVKTTGASAAELAARYEVQAAVYADAVRAIAGAKGVKFTILSVPAGHASSVEPRTNVGEVIERLRTWQGDA